jgi:GNAT superfamily N-acetyltransferase
MTITTTIAIRPATIEDAPAIAHVHIESWKTTYTGIVPASYLASLDTEARTGMWREQLANGNPILFVAEAPSGIVGFVCGGPLREPVETYDAELYAIYLLQEQQQQGTGRLLIHTVATILRERGFNKMLLWVLQQNPATSFYKHLGAVEVEQKQIEIGGASLQELALGWTDLHTLAPDKLGINPA